NSKQYRAVFTNAAGTAQTTAGLTVNPPPTITTNPTSRMACAGSTATFTAADGVGSTVQWQVSLDGTTFTNIPGATSTTYSFTTALADNNKQYRAVFTNGCGSTNTTAATLITTAPTIATQPANTTTVCPNTTATFTAADGVNSTVQWQVSTDGTSYTNIAGATSTTYSFT